MEATARHRGRTPRSMQPMRDAGSTQSTSDAQHSRTNENGEGAQESANQLLVLGVLRELARRALAHAVPQLPEQRAHLPLQRGRRTTRATTSARLRGWTHSKRAACTQPQTTRLGTKHSVKHMQLIATSAHQQHLTASANRAHQKSATHARTRSKTQRQRTQEIKQRADMQEHAGVVDWERSAVGHNRISRNHDGPRRLFAETVHLTAAARAKSKTTAAPTARDNRNKTRTSGPDISMRLRPRWSRSSGCTIRKRTANTAKADQQPAIMHHEISLGWTKATTVMHRAKHRATHGHERSWIWTRASDAGSTEDSA